MRDATEGLPKKKRSLGMFEIALFNADLVGKPSIPYGESTN